MCLRRQSASHGMKFTHVVPKVQSTLGGEEDTENAAEALLPHRLMRQNLLKKKTEMMNGLHFKVPVIGFEGGS